MITPDEIMMPVLNPIDFNVVIVEALMMLLEVSEFILDEL